MGQEGADIQAGFEKLNTARQSLQSWYWPYHDRYRNNTVTVLTTVFQYIYIRITINLQRYIHLCSICIYAYMPGDGVQVGVYVLR